MTGSLLLSYLIQRDAGKKKYNVLIYIILVILLFHIKAYFVFAGFGLGLYFLIHSRKDFVKFITCGIAGGLTSFIIVSWLFPLYLTEILPLAQGQGTNNGFRFSIWQNVELAFLYYPVITIIIVLYCALLLKRMCNSNSRIVYKEEFISSY